MPWLSNVNPWRVGVVAMLAALIGLGLYDYGLQLQLKKAEVVYKNPERIVQIKKVRVEGPTRIVTRVVEVAGRKETTTEEVRGAVMETSGTTTIERPILAARTSGWVAGGGCDRWKPSKAPDFALYGGYRVGGRLDLLGRVNGAGNAGFVVLWRF